MWERMRELPSNGTQIDARVKAISEPKPYRPGMTSFPRFRSVAMSQAGINRLSRPNTITLFAITTPSAK